jgi:hypothetical protein
MWSRTLHSNTCGLTIRYLFTGLPGLVLALIYRTEEFRVYKNGK